MLLADPVLVIHFMRYVPLLDHRGFMLSSTSFSPVNGNVSNTNPLSACPSNGDTVFSLAQETWRDPIHPCKPLIICIFMRRDVEARQVLIVN